MTSPADVRNVQEEVNYLIENLGMSEEEAYDTLGLMPPGEEPLLDEDIEKPHEQKPADILIEMFPRIDINTIREALEEANQSIDTASDLLLNWELLNESKDGDENTAKRRNWTKYGKKLRKVNRKDEKLLEAEDADVATIVAALKISEEEARELYWSHGNDVKAVIMMKTPQVPLTTRLAAENKVREQQQQRNRMRNSLNVTDYTSMRPYQLKQQIDAVQQRIQALEASRRGYSKDKLATVLITDISSEIRELKHELRQMQLALNASHKLGRQVSTKVDLHGCSLDEAKAVTEEAMRVFKETREPEIEIVSGAGRHSQKGKAVIKEWLRSYLKQQNVMVSETEGSFVVRQRIRF